MNASLALKFVQFTTLLVSFQIAHAMDSVSPPLYAVKVDTRPGEATYITMLPPETFLSGGVPAEAIVGQVMGSGSEITSASFARNSVFVTFLHDFIARASPRDPDLQQQAKRIGNGSLPLVDQRAVGTPSAEDIFGTFKVVNGKIASYERNPQHRILGSRGFFRLSKALEHGLVQELSARGKRER